MENLSLPVWESLNINPIMSSLKIEKKEIRQKLHICWHCLFLFDLPIRKEEGKFKQGTKNVHQGLSKVFVFFTYSRVTQQNLNDSTERKCPHCGLEWRAVLSCYWYTLHNVLLTEWLMWDLLIFGLVYAVVTWWNNVKYGWV